MAGDLAPGFGAMAARERSFSVAESEYPFAANWLEIDGIAMHYVDEGEGIAVLMLHGNPTWSYLYRHVIRDLVGSCRCIAPDYLGFGFSDHPQDFGYTPQEHAEWVDALIDHLGVNQVILVVHDWGGPIGMAVAVRRPETIAGLVICNTWCWPLPPYAWTFSIIFGGPLGKYLSLQRNFFARRIFPVGIAREKKEPELLRAYTDPFPTPESRIGTYVFPRRLRMSDPWLRSLEERLPSLRDRPVEIIWGMKDPVFGRGTLIRRWQRYFSDARVDRIESARHAVPEESPTRVAAGVRRLLGRLSAVTAESRPSGQGC